MGSPPHMQGARPHGDRGVFQLGITPAYAGNTSAGLRIAFDQADHPRVCGEHIGEVTAISGADGSSPRMRGAPVRGRLGRPENGIIPAYAGGTLPKTAELHRFHFPEQPKNFDSNTLHLSNNIANYPTGRAATNRNRTPSHGQHHTCKPSKKPERQSRGEYPPPSTTST